MRRAAAAALVVAALALAGCATGDEVRAACRGHDGVAFVTGTSARKNVTCRDGFFREVR